MTPSDIDEYIKTVIKEKGKVPQLKNNHSIRVYPINSAPCGKPWYEWVQRWWQWCYSEPYETQCMIVLESHVLKVRSTKTYSVGPTAVKFLPSCKLGEHYQNDLKLVQTWYEYIMRSS